MYVAKVYLDKNLMDIGHYEEYEHFLSDLTCSGSDLYDHIPKEVIAEIDFKSPRIDTGSEDHLGFGCDFEYEYGSRLMVYCGALLTAEELARNMAKH